MIGKRAEDKRQTGVKIIPAQVSVVIHVKVVKTIDKIVIAII
jgi:hypothetical protein